MVPDEATAQGDIYVSIHRQQYGPIDQATLKQWLAEQRVSATDWVWIEAARDWFPVLLIPELNALLYHFDEKPGAPPVPPAAEAATEAAAPEIGTRVFFHEKGITDEELLKQRQMMRLAIHLPILYSSSNREFSDLLSFSRSELIDISLMGMAFEVREYYPAGTTLKTFIELPTGHKFQATIKVVRCHRSPRDPELFNVGGKYSLLPASERRKLEKYIDYVIRIGATGASQ